MYNKNWICQHCGYETNKKQNYEKHTSRPSACDKRLKRHDKKLNEKKVAEYGKKVAGLTKKVADYDEKVAGLKKKVADYDEKVADQLNKDKCCKYCNKDFTLKKTKDKHEDICNGVHSLQCPTCRIEFTSKFSKYRHIKKASCELVLSEEQQRIKHLEEQLEKKEQALEKSEAKRKQAENKSTTTINNITNNNITNNYFDQSINYNNYDQLSLKHISNDDIKRLFDSCKMQYPELSEDLTRMILSPKENQSIFLPEGQKSNTCTVMKDGLEMRKPLIRVLMSLGMQTATLIHNADVIERNKKDILNNQFWADNRNACGLHICAIDELNETDKEIVQRNKNIVLDMCEGRV